MNRIPHTDHLHHSAVRYAGNVQGVGFRATCADIAKRHPGIAGTVRNLPDGSVELHAQGPPEDVQCFLDDIAATMRRYIHNAAHAHAEPDPTLTGFRILR